ncbi:MAG TPA: LPXTG cell wall anchor domain-containing protein [Marmoricola sp.]|jgi:LPXTG-motif cell wall-anchored protein|nr:LPXTG cell wall anchor domain-containing protein [Marmoricola sp.]
MKKLVVIGVSALVAFIAAIGLAQSASAYPETTCSVTVNAQKILSGSELKVTGSAQQFTTPRHSARLAATTVHWKATFNNVIHQADVNNFSTTFKVPAVTAKKVYPLVVQALMPDATTTCQRTLDITVEPSGTHVTPPTGPTLPNTGGPRLALLIAGFALVLAGGGAIYTSRKRHGGGHTA